MSRDRRIHFVIHNQGDYNEQKKEELLAYIKAKYKNLEGYLIAQEHYKHQTEDTHLQGNLFFHNAVRFSGILKYLQKKYKETKTEQGLKGRIDIDYIKHEGKAMNYMINSTKDGGDPDPLSEMSARKLRHELHRINTDLREVIVETWNMTHPEQQIV